MKYCFSPIMNTSSTCGILAQHAELLTIEYEPLDFRHDSLLRAAHQFLDQCRVFRQILHKYFGNFVLLPESRQLLQCVQRILGIVFVLRNLA